MKFSGIIKKGAGRGKELGFRTANLDLPKDLEIKDGIYFGTLIGAPALIFVGAAETFGETEKKVEVHILDFDGVELYGHEVEVEIEKFFRPNMKFNSKEELIVQMKKDELEARKHFGLKNVI